MFKPDDKPNNYFNTWEYVEHIRLAELQRDEGDGGHGSWELSLLASGFDATELEALRRESDHYSSPIEALTYWCERGVLVPPEITTAITDAMRHYLLSEAVYKEKISLEEIFFGKPMQRTGPRSSRISKEFGPNRHYSFQEFDKYLENSEQGFATKECSALAFFDSIAASRETKYQQTKTLDQDISRQEYFGNQAAPPDIDSFLRGYRRWKEKMKEDKK